MEYIKNPMEIQSYKVLTVLLLIVCHPSISLAEEKPSYRLALSWPAPSTSPPWAYEKLKDIDLAPNGDVYISDKRNIYKFNAQGEFIEIWKSGLLENYSMEITAVGDIYLSEYNRERIRKFNPAGEVISTWSGHYGRLFTVENGHVYIFNNGKVFQYTEQEVFIRKLSGIKQYKISDSSWNKKVAIDPEGGIYTLNHTRNYQFIRHLSAIGEYINSSDFEAAPNKYTRKYWSIANGFDGSPYSIKSSIDVYGHFDRSTDVFGYHLPQPVIKIAADRSIFILTEAGDIKQFSEAGTLIRNWGNDFILAKEGFLYKPEGLSVAPDGSVYVADTYNHRIQQFSATGTFIRTLGKEGTENGQFKLPRDVVVNKNGDIYVSDTRNSRIQQFDSAGNFIRAWKSSEPREMAISSDGSLYVVGTFFDLTIDQFSQSGVLLSEPQPQDLPDDLLLSLGLKKYDIGYFPGSKGDMAIAPDGSVYIADSVNNRIFKVVPEK